MATAHLRRLWREAQARRRAKLETLGITGKRKAHSPPQAHPWRVEQRVAWSRTERAMFEYVDEDDSPDLRVLGLPLPKERQW